MSGAMSGAIVVLWLGTGPELAERSAEIDAWASRQKLHAEPLRPAAPSYDAALVDELEALLEEARTTPSTRGASPALERAEALLLEHPELPQAAWLLAERQAIEAGALVALDAAAAARRLELGKTAARLEGVRAATAGTPEPGPDAPAPSEPVTSAPVPRGARPHDRVFIDGVEVSAEAGAPVTLAPGRHHALVARGTVSVWAGWLRLEPGHVVQLPDVGPACSAHDLADVGGGSEAPGPAPGVRCERWAVARPSSAGGIDVAECAAARCGPWQHAGVERFVGALVVLPPAREPERGEWPGWATWSLVGAGALAATGLVLWQVGAFHGGSRETEFVFTGPSASAYHF